MATITGAVAWGADTPFTLDEIELDDIRDDEILVQIKGVGLCHTDIAARDGLYGLSYPTLLGHEGSGVVTQVGRTVTSLAPGDQVLLSFGSCGTCRTCRNGDMSYCEQFTTYNYIGSRPDGTRPLHLNGQPVGSNFFNQSSFGTYAIANERNTVKVDADLDVSLLGPLGCGLQTGAGAIMRSLACEADSILVVIGAGPVGLAAVMAGVVQGCTEIIVVEPLVARRELAQSLGATATVDPTAGDLTEAIRATASRGVDYIFDTSGRPETISAAIEAAGQKAAVGLVGVPRDLTAVLPLSIIGAMSRGLRVQGIVEGDSDPQVFLPELIELYRQGRFPFDRLITTYPLSDINEAIAAQHRGDVTKVVLIP